jgi:hypothetical protein
MTAIESIMTVATIAAFKISRMSVRLQGEAARGFTLAETGASMVPTSAMTVAYFRVTVAVQPARLSPGFSAVSLERPAFLQTIAVTASYRVLAERFATTVT